MIGFLRSYLRPYRTAITIVIVLIAIQSLTNLYLPFLNADIINDGVITGDIGYILEVGATMLGLTLALGVVSVIAVYFSARTAMGFGRDVRKSLFRSVESLSLREVNEFGAPSLITRNTNDVQQVQMLVLVGLTILISAPLTAIGGVIMALRTNLQLSALLLVIVPIMAVVIGAIVSRAVPLFRSVQTKIDTINAVLRENLSGIRVIRAFVRTRSEEERFEAANDDLTDTSLRVARLFALMMPLLMLVFNISSVAVIWFGGGLVDSGEIQIGDLTAFLAYIMQILFSVMMAVMLMTMVPRAAASAERIQEVLATQPEIVDPESPVTPAQHAGEIELREVEFRYAGAQEPVLCHVSFTIRPGQVTAIVGGTGSGKTTLVNLLTRLYDVTGGAILVDGVDIREQAQEELWSRFGLVPQKAFLFRGTVASNIRFGAENASDAQLWQALQIAQADSFVSQMPDGIDSEIDQGGTNVSGGQRQRLAIARALVRQAPVYVFDDSFSALDYATDARLRAALRSQTAEAAVVVVAQRISTIRDADQIVVLDEGTVAGIGRHEELMQDCPTYSEIVLSQLTETEATR
ncbi:MAG: ABC transporter ATP-binding protein/permease [Actinomycetia bacterium]|nr:ABC transporter ATP-binding protein/permease [Actinomycetes bacterium]MCH9800679.1 ABC transporter ATP-binding protein/permease [Actinomycetes bacterium]